MGLLQDFIDACKPNKPVFTSPKAIVEDAIDHQVMWSKWEGRETEEDLRLRLRAHWPKALGSSIDAAVERRFHPERRN